MPEFWLTGPVDGVDPVLMPAAHAFLQVRAEVPQLLDGLTTEQIWTRVGGSASIGFHALHLAGATERLLTYARAEQLSETQEVALRDERNARHVGRQRLPSTVLGLIFHAAEHATRHTGQIATLRRISGPIADL